MMEKGSFLFHNVSQMTKQDAYPGYSLQRFPDHVRSSTNMDVADLCRSVEIRCYVEKEQPALSGGRVYLMAKDEDSEAVVFWGDYQSRKVTLLPKGVVTPVPVVYPQLLDQMPAGRFANRVCRIFLNTRACVQYIGAEYLNARLPQPDEMPAKTLIGYGSSITHGGVARSNCNCYLQLAARTLGMDALNLGLSGSCFASREMADYLADQVQGDIFFVELGANMLGLFPVEEYLRRCEYTVSRIAQTHPDSQVLVTGCYPAGIHQSEDKRTAYNDGLAACIRKMALKNLRFIHPDTLLGDLTWLAEDGLHPSDYGHIQMANVLTSVIRNFDK